MARKLFEGSEENCIYNVPVVKGPLYGTVRVPGSKSMTNRALLMAALGDGPTRLTGVLFSDDSRHFLGSLQSLGFQVEMDEADESVVVHGCNGRIPLQEAEIHVGSAGTAARFLTAMLALSEGTYTIQCSEQMRKRPMAPLFEALSTTGARFEYLGEVGHLPVRVQGNGRECQDITMDISKSTQFLSAMLMMGPMTGKDLRIRITSEKKDGSYIRITRNMMKEFGVDTELDGDTYLIPGNQKYHMRTYDIEPDVSGACYFYGAAAITGGEILVKGVKKGLMQGDMRFLELLEQLGCSLVEEPEGIKVKGPAGGLYHGISIDMNDFSDQALTLAALAAYGTSPTRILNVGHIKVQECDRMEAIVQELAKVGISCEADGNNITIYPGVPHGAQIETYDDHRVAMAFALLGLRTQGIQILDPKCCRKTFEHYFQVLDDLILKNT